MNHHKRQAAADLAADLMKQHGLIGWSFGFDRATRRLGQCDYRNRTITLSGPLTDLNDLETMRNTILHEIAHALTPGAQHGPAWRAACRRIGAEPERTAKAEDLTLTPARYYLECPHCGTRMPRQRRPKRRYVCRRCWVKHTHGQGPRPEALVVIDNRSASR
jgi:predicted SprT family Zn-dependent metalloprotease